VDRAPGSFTLLLCDGIGSGSGANVAATACAARLRGLLREGFSPRQAFSRLVRSMNAARETGLPFTAFSMIRVLPDGAATVLLYETPDCILTGPRYAAVLESQKSTVERALVGEVNCWLAPGEGILAVSDGISQAGIGGSRRNGWGLGEASRFVGSCLAEGIPITELPGRVHAEARKLWGASAGDDCTAALASCRPGRPLTILTGPPGDRSRDTAVVRDFLLREGKKVICGGTTAGIVARVKGTTVAVDPERDARIAPPAYGVEGIDLVTEGAVTLTQVLNIWDEDPRRFDEESGVTQLWRMLKEADRVTIMRGGARNPANGAIDYRQRGILGRERIVPLLAERLVAEDKLVILEEV